MISREELFAEASALTAEATRIDDDQRAYVTAVRDVGMRHSGQSGTTGLAEARQKLTAALEQIAPVLRENRSAMIDAIGLAARSAVADLPDDEAERVWQVAGKASELPGFRDIEGYLGALSNRYDDRAGGVGPAVKTMLKAARNTLATANPSHANRIKAINHGWDTIDRIQPSSDKPNPAHYIFKRHQ